jgi:general secretion pathway protein F
MPAYQFVAVNQSGKEQRGVIEADTDKHARQLLRDRHLIPLKVQTVQKKSVSGQSSFQFLKPKRSLSSKELALITRQFATLLSAGLPLEEALQAVAEQTEKSKVQGLILSVRSLVVEGYALAHALHQHPDAFSDLFCATIAAGEKSGHLDKVLLRLAEYTEQQWHLQQKLKTALIYPVMIILVAIGIVGFLLAYVVPKMVTMYGHLKQGLPEMTQVLLAISYFVQHDSIYFIILLGVGLFFWSRALKKNPRLRERTQLFMLRIPLFGYAFKTSDTARFARTLSILTAAGVSVLEAITISSELVKMIPIRSALSTTAKRVREGAPIHFALKQTQYFSPMSIHMIASGEASGQLESMLERVALNQEGEITRLIDVALSLFEPAIILIMGSVVLFIVLAVLLPIFNLNQFTG